MIVVDTNVISEAVRTRPNEQVVNWLDLQAADQLYLVAPVKAELLFGLFSLPEGARRRSLEAATLALLDSFFDARFLPFDGAAAENYASIASREQKAGRTIGVMDGQIAAIASAWGATIATRDTAPFTAAGIATFNPWVA